MGNFYSNVVVKGPSEEQVVGCLCGLGRTALVVSHPSGLVFVYDEEGDTLEEGVIESLALTLARRLECPALASLNYHDESLLLWLYAPSGTEVRFGWGVKSEDGEVSAPRDQFCAEVRRLFGTVAIAPPPLPLRLRVVALIFGRGFAIAHHEKVLHEGGIPVLPAVLGYRYVERGELTENEPGLVARRVRQR